MCVSMKFGGRYVMNVNYIRNIPVQVINYEIFVRGNDLRFSLTKLVK